MRQFMEEHAQAFFTFIHKTWFHWASVILGLLLYHIGKTLEQIRDTLKEIALDTDKIFWETRGPNEEEIDGKW